eukprot:29243-Pelagococcus_subviridis.AAC.13
MILTLSAGAMTLFAIAPAVPPAMRLSTAVADLDSMYVAGVGVGASFAPAINVFLAAGTASFKTSFAVNPIAAATGPFTHVSPTPLNSPFATPSLT